MLILFIISQLIEYSSSTLLVYTFGNRDLLLNTTKYSIANFGNVPYGQQLHGQLFMPPLQQSDLLIGQFCDLKTINSYSPYFSFKPDKWIISRVGGCSITQKAILAQKLQAKLLLIFDDKADDNSELFIIDDGNGYQIYIPVIMIRQNEANILYKQLANDQPGGSLNAHIKFNQIIQTQKPQVLFGLDISNRDTFKLIKNFKKYYDELKDFIDFDIFYHLFQCPRCKQQNYTEQQIDCINNGRYCQLDSNDYENGNGADIVMEQYRQLCLWQLNHTYWWRYMNYFSSQCSQPKQFQSCFEFYISEDIQKNLSECLIQRNGQIELLERQFLLQMKSGIVYFPGLTINGKIFRGNMDVDIIKNALCSSFKDLTNISVCNNQLLLIEEQTSYKWLIILVLCMIIIFLLFIFFIFREMLKNQMKQQMKAQIEQALNEYIQYYEN
ncbi:unnamed protein product [Paramecium primaurelia]|uniref:Vacuolar sorting receptor thioredoxin-like domain-containing protein n=1 Tax=Paramecium primaurelia TaxID=5886 RepID=A0A8S1LMM2_PARPR|nr:unnamed protein product [Paramecium primaurelia]